MQSNNAVWKSWSEVLYYYYIARIEHSCTSVVLFKKMYGCMPNCTHILQETCTLHFTVKEIKERLWPMSRLLQIKHELRCVLYTIFLLRNMSIVAGWPEIIILCFQTPPNFCKMVYFCVSMFSVGKSQFLWACLK